jgi:hypothetical protein
MLRSDALSAYQEYSKRTSENVRQLALAALAVVWLFRPAEVAGAWHWPRPLIAAGAFATIALTCDFVHYLWNTIAWGWFHRRKEKEGVPLGGLVLAPRHINRPGAVFFALKTTALCAAYGFLLYVVAHRLTTA